MKGIICLLLCSFIFVSSQYCNSIIGTPSKASDCKGISVLQENDYCCFMKSKAKSMGVSVDNPNQCVEITPAQYANIKEAIKEIEKQNSGLLELVIKKLDCKSSYLAFSLLSLVLLFL